MTTRDLITIGASAGGIGTLSRLLAKLPGDLPAAIMIVQHLSPSFDSQLDEILGCQSSLPVRFAADGDPIERGRIYLAPRDNHLLVAKDRVRVVRGPRENLHRPAVDPLFRSAAWAYGPRVIGMVLSGTMDDGASGLWAIRSCGGVAVVQDPKDAQYKEMPTSALMMLNVDHCLSLDAMPALLERLTREPISSPSPHTPLTTPAAAGIGLEVAVATREQHSDVEDLHKIGTPVGFTCPTCHGALWELKEGELVVYRCHVGHAFGPDSLVAAQDEGVEQALESALRALEEQSATARRLGSRLEQAIPDTAARYEARADGLEKQAAVIRRVLRQAVPMND